MNKIILSGRLTRDPDVKYSQEGKCVARYTLASPRLKTGADGKDADFINCVAFGKSAEFVEKYLKKGTKMLVCGRLQSGNYQNKDGATVYTLDVIIESQEFAESKSSGSNAGSGAAPSAPSTPAGNPYSGAGDGFMNIPDGLDEELPFN